MGHREKLKGGDEFDLVCGWKRVLCYMQKSGVSKAIKKKMNKRSRRKSKQEIFNLS